MKVKFKTIISSILVLVLVFVLTPLSITLSAGVTSLTSGATYYVKNKWSQIYLTADNSGANGAYITQENFTGASNQQWRLTYNGTHWLLSPQNYILVTTYMKYTAAEQTTAHSCVLGPERITPHSGKPSVSRQGCFL